MPRLQAHVFCHVPVVPTPLMALTPCALHDTSGHVASGAILRPTSRLLMRSGGGGFAGGRLGNFSPMDTVDMNQISLNSRVDAMDDQSTTAAMQLNLFHDPDGGLTAGPAEELSATELTAQVDSLIRNFSLDVYYLLYTPFVDVVGCVMQQRNPSLMPTPAPGKPVEVTVARWFSDGATTLQSRNVHSALCDDARANAVLAAGKQQQQQRGLQTGSEYDERRRCRRIEPTADASPWPGHGGGEPAVYGYDCDTHAAMGHTRWGLFTAALRAHHAPMHALSPLVRCVRKYQMSESVWVPMLRQLCMDLADTRRRAATVTVLPGLTLSLANGRTVSSALRWGLSDCEGDDSPACAHLKQQNQPQCMSTVKEKQWKEMTMRKPVPRHWCIRFRRLHRVWHRRSRRTRCT